MEKISEEWPPAKQVHTWKNAARKEKRELTESMSSKKEMTNHLTRGVKRKGNPNTGRRNSQQLRNCERTIRR